MNIRNFFRPKPKEQPTDKRLKTKAVLFPTVLRAIDMDTFTDAVNIYKNIQYPLTYKWVELVHDLMDVDGHLNSVITKRRNAILNLDLVFADDNGEEIQEVTRFVNHPTFSVRFQRDIMDTLFFGHTAVQFDYKQPLFAYDLLPRENLLPQSGLFVTNKYQSRDGIALNEQPYNQNCIFIWTGDMGLMQAVAQYAIIKRNAMFDYSEYAERYAMPIQDVVYKGNDPKVKAQIESTLKNQGSAASLIWPEDAEVNMRQGANTSSNEIYTALLDFCNKEMSKVILGQTMTTDDGSSRSQAQVHKEVEDAIFAADKQFMLHFLNYTMKPYLSKWGLPVDTGEFKYEETEKEDLITLIEADLKLKELIPIDPDYWYEKYGVPKPKQTGA